MLHATWYVARFYEISYVEGVERNKNSHNTVHTFISYVEGVKSSFDLQCRF